MVLLLQFGALSCDDDGNGGSGSDASADAGCLPELPADCVPAYDPPTFGAIYENVFRRTCGSAATGTACHGEAGAMAGLVLGGGEARAYDDLLDPTDGHIPRVIPGEPECSMLVQRIESDDPAFRMPVGAQKLSAGERCAIRLWIERGAEP